MKLAIKNIQTLRTRLVILSNIVQQLCNDKQGNMDVSDML